MGRKRRFGRQVDGVVIIDKPAGMTSNDVVQKTKRLFFASKAGHTGALDPLATGVLPVCLGEATKFSQFLLDADKVYESIFSFGVTTDTGDADGRQLEITDSSELTQDKIEAQIDKLRGDIMQVPPMYSALKKNGQPLYKLARAGIEVERAARPVTIHEFSILNFVPGARAEVEVRVHCTKGTYIRSLAEELGGALGVGAHVRTLNRIQTGALHIDDSMTLSGIEEERGDERAESLDHHLLPVDVMLRSLSQIELDPDSAYYFTQGQAVMDTQVYRIGEEGDTVRVFRTDGCFLGLGEINGDGGVAPKRLVSNAVKTN